MLVLHLILETLWGRLRVLPSFQIEEWSRCLTRGGSLPRLPTGGCEALDSTYGSLCPPSSLRKAVPSSFLNGCGLHSLPLIRQWPQKTPSNNKKPQCFFLSSSLQVIFKHLWSWRQQITKCSAAPCCGPCPQGCHLLSSSGQCSALKHTPGNPRPMSPGCLRPGLQRSLSSEIRGSLGRELAPNQAEV